EEMVGQVERLETARAIDHFKATGLDFSKIFYLPDRAQGSPRHWMKPQEHGLEESLDATKLVPLCQPALDRREKVVVTLPICNVNRVVGTLLGSEVTRLHGRQGLPD